MLTDEQAQELFKNEHCNISKELAGILARAIIAAVLPEGWVAVPREPTEKILEWLDPGFGTRREAYAAMLAAALKPAQCNCQQGQVCPVCDPDLVPAQAEKQEPVNDEPVARVDANDDGYWAEILPDRSVKVGQLLYTRPQPDLTAEVERLKLSAEHWNRLYREKCQEFHDAQANKGHEIVWLIDRIAALEALVSTREDDIRTEKMWVQRHAERIAELEEAARQARDAFEQHDGNYKLSKASGAVVEAAIAKLDAVLGNAD